MNSSKNKSNIYKLEIKLQGPCKNFLLLKPDKLYNIGKTFTIMCRLHLYTQDFVHFDDMVRLLHFFLRFRYCIFDRPIDKRFYKTSFLKIGQMMESALMKRLLQEKPILATH